MSSFAWLDFSESDRQKALDVIDLFREKGTVDELGIGTIRDAMADLLFPGTSTIMTRARYYLFIPWIYLRHEGKKTSSSEIAHAARKDEIKLIEALKRGGSSQGVIGIESGPALKRIPSTIYWQSLGVLRIRLYPGSRDHYHRAMDSFHKKGDVIKAEDGHVITGGHLRRWDPSLPPPPPDFLQESSLTLTVKDADYLRERIMHAAPRSLFAFLVNHPMTAWDSDYPWEHELASQFPEHNRVELAHAQNFAEAMHGSAILYNLMLAEKRAEPEWQSAYQTAFNAWAELMVVRRTSLRAWKRDEFWKLIHGTGARIPPGTFAFVNQWLDKSINGDATGLQQSKSARNLIGERERLLKGELARLANARALDVWLGASSASRLSYRWNRPVKWILADIRQPLDK